MTKEEKHDVLYFMPDDSYTVCMYWAVSNVQPNMYGTLMGIWGDTFKDPYKAKALCDELEKFNRQYFIAKLIHKDGAAVGYRFIDVSLPVGFKVVPTRIIKQFDGWFDLAQVGGNEYGSVIWQGHIPGEFLWRAMVHIGKELEHAYDVVIGQLERAPYL